jgi:hypothetical protein
VVDYASDFPLAGLRTVFIIFSFTAPSSSMKKTYLLEHIYRCLENRDVHTFGGHGGGLGRN